MKKFKLMMMAAMFAFAGTASAQVTCFTADNVAFGEGEETADLIVNMDYTPAEGVTICCWQFDLYLPDGIAPIYDEEEEEWLGEVSDETNRKKFVKNGLKITPKTDGGYIVLGYDDGGNAAMTSTHGKLLEITLSAASQLEGEGAIKNSSLADLNNVSVDQGQLSDANFNVDATKAQVTVGINDIKAADATAPAYNLQGVRVNGAAKGLIIRDGKKMIVK